MNKKVKLVDGLRLKQPLRHSALFLKQKKIFQQ